MKALIIIASLIAAQVAMACGAQSNARLNSNTAAKRVAANQATPADLSKAANGNK